MRRWSILRIKSQHCSQPANNWVANGWANSGLAPGPTGTGLAVENVYLVACDCPQKSGIRAISLKGGLCSSHTMRIFLLTLILSLPALAANHYVRAGASGSASGADWTNACTDFSGSCAVSTLVRGDTYYVAVGSYAARTWNRAVSGSLLITIQRATVANHGTDTGWSANFDAQVVWAGGHTVSTGFWMFDGVTATTMSNATTYGFYYTHPPNCSSNQISIASIGATNVSFKNVATDMCGVSFDFAKWCIEITPGADNTVISHAYCVNSIDFIQTNGDQAQSNATYEYIYTKNNGGTGTNHGEVYQLVCNGCTIRYNVFEDCSSTSCISGNAATAPGAPNLIPMFNTKIYGNVFKNVDAGNGVIHAAGSTGIAGTRFYNNTIVGQTTGPFFDECSGHTCPSGSGNNIVENNLIWNGHCDLGGFGLAGDVHNYNTFLSCTTTPSSEANGQTGSYNPFVSSATGNYHLATYTVGTCASTTTLCAGVALASPYNIDPDGNTRGSGTWDRGAFELTTNVVAPNPPTGLITTVQ